MGPLLGGVFTEKVTVFSIANMFILVAMGILRDCSD